MAYIFLVTKQKTQNQSIYNQEIARGGGGKGREPSFLLIPFRQLLRRQANSKESCKWEENGNGTKFLVWENVQIHAKTCNT